MQILGMNMETVEANAAFVEKFQFPFPLLSDTTGEVCRTYAACDDSLSSRPRRMTYVIGSDGTVLRIVQDVDPEDHAEVVLAFLRESSDRIDMGELSENGVNMNTQKGMEGNMNGSISETKNDQVHQTAGNGLREATLDQPLTPTADIPDEVRVDQKVVSSALVSASDVSQPDQRQPVAPGRVQPAQNGTSLVFALGKLGYDFGAEARRDSITQDMGGDDLLEYLEKNPSQAAAIIWTLSVDATPIYAIRPQGSFAGEVYALLRRFLKEQAAEGVERVSIPGIIIGQVRLLSGQIVPVIRPELRCMYSWSTAALVEAVCGKPPKASAKAQEKQAYAEEAESVANFLERIYHELRNLGVSSQERAMNYAAANVANAKNIFGSALGKKLALHSVDVVSSPICRPGSDCWDVKLLFFDPENVLRAKTVYRFTVDVSDVCPVMVGQVRSWSMP